MTGQLEIGRMTHCHVSEVGFMHENDFAFFRRDIRQRGVEFVGSLVNVIDSNDPQASAITLDGQRAIS
jgi:hypothetical protein